MSEKLTLNPLLSRKQGATELYLIRHGDALPGAETVIPGGGYDSQPLSELGQRQAQALGKWLSSVTFDALYSSPLRRCQETAAPLAQILQMPVVTEAELREVRLNMDLAGPGPADEPAATSAALRARMDEIIQRAGQVGKWSAIAGSEASAPFRERVLKVIGQIGSRHPGQRVAIFSHGGVINAYAAELLGLERDFFFPIYNTSVSIIRWQDRQSSLVSLNEIAHLRIGEVETED